MAASPINLSDVLEGLPAGAWAAIYKHAVVAYGADVQQVLAQARANGVDDPLIVKVPESPEMLFL